MAVTMKSPSHTSTYAPSAMEEDPPSPRSPRPPIALTSPTSPILPTAQFLADWKNYYPISEKWRNFNITDHKDLRHPAYQYIQ
jgi:hypothetical protein